MLAHKFVYDGCKVVTTKPHYRWGKTFLEEDGVLVMEAVTRTALGSDRFIVLQFRVQIYHGSWVCSTMGFSELALRYM